MPTPNDLAETKIVVEPTPPPRPRRKIWWGLIGLFVGLVAGELIAPQVFGGDYAAHVQSNAKILIHSALMGAAIGFGIEFGAGKTSGACQLQFGLKSLFVVFYIIGVVVFTVRNYLILISL